MAPRVQQVNSAIDYAGTRISLPADPKKMGVTDAIKTLEYVRTYEEQTVIVEESFPEVFWADAANAFAEAAKERYGIMLQETEPPRSFFDSPHPPETKSIPTDVGQFVKVPFGRTKLPGIDGHVDVTLQVKEGRAILTLRAEVKRLWEDEVHQLAMATRAYVKANSIYKGKSFRMKFEPDLDYRGNPDWLSVTPRFIDVKHASPEQLIFPKVVADAVATNLFTPLESYGRLAEVGVPFKRGVLLAGHFGTGKTLSAMVAAKLANQHGITFVLVDNPEEFSQAVAFARQYEPAVVFCEDIDRVMAGERTVEIDKILNTVDGIDSKSTNIMVVLTTNQVDRINQAMIRPGRLDVVIEYQPPDAEAVGRLIRHYAGKTLDPKANLVEVSQKLDRQIPAVIREVVERSKLAALRRTKPGDTILLSDAALVESADTMGMQMRLLNRKPKLEPNQFEVMGNALGKYIVKAVETITTIQNAAAEDNTRRKAMVHPQDNPRRWETLEAPEFPEGEWGWDEDEAAKN